MLAVVVATPVLERLTGRGQRGLVGGVVGSATYLELGSFVVALTARGVPLMPNGIALAERPGAARWPRPQAIAHVAAGRIQAGAWTVTWALDEPPAWDPTLRAASGAPAAAVAARGDEILRACGIDGDLMPPGLAVAFAAGGVQIAHESAGRNGIALLLRSVATRDPELAARAVDLLIGRGPGLTPEGDDVVAGAAAAVFALGEVAGWDAAGRLAWLSALRPPSLHRLTTPLSATLLELALTGRVVEPVHGLLDLAPSGARSWRGALQRLTRIGHSTGPAYAAAVGACAILLAA